MKRTLACSVAVVAVGLLALRLVSAAPFAPKQFMASLIISEFRDGQWTIVAQPTVAVPDGMEGTLQAGGEAMDAETQRRIPYGIQARIRVREIEAGKLRLSMHVSQGTLDETEDSSFVIREWSLHCVRTIAPGEQVEFELGSDRKVAVRLSPVNPRR